MNARNCFERLMPVGKLLQGALAAAVITIPLTLGMASAAKGGIPGQKRAMGDTLAFRTVSIKLNENAGCCAMMLSKDRFVATDSAINMIMAAYGGKSPLKPAQVLGGPDWMKTDVFSIDAEPSKFLSGQVKAPLRLAGPGPALLYIPGFPGADVVTQAFRSLLMNRFKLRIKHETEVLPVYELVLAKVGPKMAKDKAGGGSCRIGDVGPNLPPVSARGKGRWLDVNCDFGTFAGVLSASPEFGSRVLVDKTGLRGRYSFRLHWTPEMPTGMHTPTNGGQSNNSAALSTPSGSSLFTALREQLGLEVKSTKAPVDTIVVQHIENPAKN